LGFGWITAMGASGSVHSWLAPTNQVGFVFGALGRLTATGTTSAWLTTSAAITTTIQAAAAIGAVIATRLLWLTIAGRLHPLRALALIFAAMLILGPVVQPWYLLWTVVPFAVVVRGDAGRWALAALSAGFALVLPPVMASPGELVAGYLLAVLLLGAAVLLVFDVPGPDLPWRELSWRRSVWRPVLQRQFGRFGAHWLGASWFTGTRSQPGAPRCRSARGAGLSAVSVDSPLRATKPRSESTRRR
jgi:hypothetical protein